VDVLNPVSVEQAIRECSNRISKGVIACNRTYIEFLDADRHFDAAVARAFFNSEGSVEARKHAVVLATIDEREARDAADAAYRYCDRTAKALENELRAYQSLNASLRAQYQIAGVGEH